MLWFDFPCFEGRRQRNLQRLFCFALFCTILLYLPSQCFHNIFYHHCYLCLEGHLHCVITASQGSCSNYNNASQPMGKWSLPVALILKGRGEECILVGQANMIMLSFFALLAVFLCAPAAQLLLAPIQFQSCIIMHKQLAQHGCFSRLHYCGWDVGTGVHQYASTFNYMLLDCSVEVLQQQGHVPTSQDLYPLTEGCGNPQKGEGMQFIRQNTLPFLFRIN